MVVWRSVTSTFWSRKQKRGTLRRRGAISTLPVPVASPDPVAPPAHAGNSRLLTPCTQEDMGQGKQGGDEDGGLSCRCQPQCVG
jgi:hypothetical protein